MPENTESLPELCIFHSSDLHAFSKIKHHVLSIVKAERKPKTKFVRSWEKAREKPVFLRYFDGLQQPRQNGIIYLY